jgi:putative IMPACT (imprinted ancient) family translation regulator
MSYLLENKKIAQATHNISAYRIVTSKGTILQDCDDDGELMLVEEFCIY